MIGVHSSSTPSFVNSILAELTLSGTAILPSVIVIRILTFVAVSDSIPDVLIALIPNVYVLLSVAKNV